MPFNDMFALDLPSEFDRQSFQFVRDSDSRDHLQPSGQNNAVGSSASAENVSMP